MISNKIEENKNQFSSTFILLTPKTFDFNVEQELKICLSCFDSSRKQQAKFTKKKNSKFQHLRITLLATYSIPSNQKLPNNQPFKAEW
jgi:hypothetical protein